MLFPSTFQSLAWAWLMPPPVWPVATSILHSKCTCTPQVPGLLKSLAGTQLHSFVYFDTPSPSFSSHPAGLSTCSTSFQPPHALYHCYSVCCRLTLLEPTHSLLCRNSFVARTRSYHSFVSLWCRFGCRNRKLVWMEIKVNNRYEKTINSKGPETKTGGFRNRTANLRSRLNFGGSVGYQEFGNIEEDSGEHHKKQGPPFGSAIKRLIKKKSSLFSLKNGNR